MSREDVPVTEEYVRGYHAGYDADISPESERGGLRSKLTPGYCDCNDEPRRGIEAGRHLPSCRYGIIEEFLDAWGLGA